MEANAFPELHPMCKARFSNTRLPLTLDELETLIGRLDHSHVRGLRAWNPMKYL
jgi:hypothetical protein